MLHQVLYLSIIYGSNRRLTLRELIVVIRPDANRFPTAQNASDFLSLCQESLDPFNFEPPEPGCIGPLLHRFTVGRVFRIHAQPPVLVLPGCPECGVKLSIALVSGRGHHRGVYYLGRG
jgi:hypothetical protein